MNETKITVEPGKQTITMERTFNAPVDKVFDAFVNPEKIAKWFSGKKYTTKVDTYEGRTGGSWRLVQGDGGEEYAFRGVFHEVTPTERIIWTFEFEGLPERGHVALETMTFSEEEGKTTVKTVSVFPSVEDRDGMVASGMEEGAQESYNALAELVEQ